MTRILQHQGRALEYEFTRKKVKNINLRVRKDGSVAVSAPRGVSNQQVEAFLLARWEWLAAAQQRMLRRQQPAFTWEDGQTFHLLGEAVTLALKTGPARASFDGGVLTLTLPDPGDTAGAAALGERWFDRRCREAMADADRAVWPQFEALGASRPILSLRWMTSRWGSCLSAWGKITLNRRLFAFPPRVVEYVLCHEYCHLLEPNHREGFQRLLRQLQPDWRQYDRDLKDSAVRFIR